MKVLVTGAAGFIGSALIRCLLDRGDIVVGVDNHNNYYDPALKEARLATYAEHANYTHLRLDICDSKKIMDCFAVHKPSHVVNLAAQAGVRYSIENPMAYIESNVVGFANILEGCRHNGVEHLVYASSSSVYGANKNSPFCVSDNVDYPISLYAASKKSNELMAHTYSHLFNVPTTGLRFFTVYGPWGRPDMAYFKFTKAIVEGRPIDVYNHGEMLRDFTYIDDIVEGVVRVIDRVPQPQENVISTVKAPYKIYNIGNNQPVTLRRFITALESALGIKALENHLPMQPGDVPVTHADVDELIADVDFKPATEVENGLQQFVQWYRIYRGLE